MRSAIANPWLCEPHISPAPKDGNQGRVPVHRPGARGRPSDPLSSQLPPAPAYDGVSSSSNHFAHHRSAAVSRPRRPDQGIPVHKSRLLYCCTPPSPTKPRRIRERSTSLTPQRHRREHRRDGEGAVGTLFHSVDVALACPPTPQSNPKTPLSTTASRPYTVSHTSQSPTATGGEGDQRRRPAGKPPLASGERPRNFHRVPP